MAEDLLSNYINRETFAGDTIFAIEQFQEFKAAYEQLKGMKDILQAPAGLKEVVSTANSANTAIKDLTTTIGNQTTTITQNVKAQNDLTVSTKNALIEKEKLAKIALTEAKATTESAKANAIKTKSLIDQEKELERLIALEEKKNAAIEKSKPFDANSVPYVINQNADMPVVSGNSTVVNDLDKAQAAAALSASELGNSVNKSTTAMQGSVTVVTEAVASDKELEAAKLALTKAESEHNVQLQGYKVQTQAANAAAKEQAATALGMLSPYQLLNKEYLAAQINAKDLATQYGVESVEAKEAAASALALSLQLKEIDSSVGQNQRSVGNYTIATSNLNKQFHNFTDFASLAGTAISRLRRQFVGFFVTMASSSLIIPIIQGITAMVQGFLDMGKASAEVVKQQEDMAAAFKSAADSAADEMSKVTVLKTVLESELATREQKITALKELKSINVDYFGQLDMEDGKIKGLTNSYDAYIQKLIRSINAKANIDQLTAALKQQNDIVGTINGNMVAQGKHTLENLTQYQEIQAIAEFNLDFGKSKTGATALTPAQEQLIVNLLNAKDRVKAITDEIKGDVQDAFEPKEEKNKKGKKGSITMESVKTMTDAEFEIYKINQQRKLKLLDDEVNNEKKTLQERVLLAETYKNMSIELSDAIYNHDIKNDEAKLKVLQSNLKKSKGTEKNNIRAEIENTGADIKILQAKINDSRLAAKDAFEKKYTEISTQADEARLKAIKTANDEMEKSVKGVRAAQQSAIDAGSATELGALDLLLKQKIISQEEYNKRKKKLENQALIDSLNSQLQEAKGEQNLALVKLKEGLGGQNDLNVAINKVTDITGKIQSAKNQTDPVDKNKNEDAIAAIGLAKDLENAIQGLVDIGYQKEIDAIQRIIDLNNVRKDQEIKSIQQSSLSNQEKAAQMIILDNAVAANNRKLQREQVAVQIKQAKFDRDIAILGILENAAIAALKLTAQSGFAGIAAGISIGIEAAAQVAMLLAKPLPQMPAYEHGKNDNYEGPAIVGDGGVPEYIKRGDGTIQKTPAKDTLTYIGKSDIIFPNFNAMMMSLAMPEVLMKNSRSDSSMNEGLIISAIQNGARMTVHAMKKQKAPNVVVNVNADWSAYIQKNVRE